MAMRIKSKSFPISPYLHALFTLWLAGFSLAATAQDEKSPQELFKGEWLISATGQEPTSVFVFGENGKVVNTVNNALGTYEFLPGERLLIIFDDTLILGEYTILESKILLSSSVGSPVQKMTIALTPATEEEKTAASTRYKRIVSSYGAAMDQLQRTATEKAILNNLRQFAAAAQFHLLETRSTRVGYNDIVGPEKGKYIVTIESADGESYEELEYHTDTTRLTRIFHEG